ncbi:MAG TPA: contact-dependent growth inhibition system immunity protein [Candidatus Sulfotelmatobacter sp.]|nr:contact-dependent growth inhibition system immunity protein [Candidatus Sulfotelmatobacter sp.]
MTPNRPTQKPAATKPSAAKPEATSFSAAEYPALRSFLRGYFHQDMKDEYGSPEEAAREFCSDASGDERAAVASEWARFLDRTKGQPLDAINRILTGPLGSSYAMMEDDLKRISAILKTGRR